VAYHTSRGPARAVNGVSFSLAPGETLGLVGESGSGKSTIALALMRLLKPPARIEQGEVLLDGQNLLALSDEEMRLMRLGEIAMVAQGAMNSLNPVMRIRDQIMDAWKDHGERMSRHEADERIADLMRWVGLEPRVAKMFPHELSGGMKQRAVIAIAISLRPKVIIADEPTSALDVVVQRQIMETLQRVQADLGAAVILIGHDMGLMAQVADRLAIMYAGQISELSPRRDIFKDPLHPYSQLLISSLPSVGDKGELRGIPGLPPSLLNPPPGCPFHPRCPKVMDRCRIEAPLLERKRPQRHVSCHLYEGDG
ncbi:MAG TPA: ABC transporter ATP-binding protein, partial [Thermomicrobiales bacterium]|nr:ABC transporter ATP-binding protein [Thermomicrobiales bacterium]